MIGNFFNMDIEKKSDFNNIDDLINFCLCSSYLPYLSGNSFSREYKGSYYIDGDIKYNYKNQKDKLIDTEDVNNIIIHRNMWGRNFSPENYLYIDKDKSRKLFQQGWEDTEKNIDIDIPRKKGGSVGASISPSILSARSITKKGVPIEASYGKENDAKARTSSLPNEGLGNTR